MTKDLCREISPVASCGRKSAQRSYWHSETEGIPTGSTHERGVRNQRPRIGEAQRADGRDPRVTN